MNFFDFAKKAPTSYNAVAEMKAMLLEQGATELKETETWKIDGDKLYFVIRNDSALIAFSAPEKAKDLRVFACHGDSPTYRVKENPEIVVENTYVKLNVEPYGGMIHSTWLDKPLSVAGRVMVKDGNGLRAIPVIVDKDLLVIPNVAIHMERGINDGFKYNPQTDLLPLMGTLESKGAFMKEVANAAGVKEEDILGTDLYLYLREKGAFSGANGELMVSPRIDDLECAFGGFSAFLSASKKEHISVFAMLDNEEVGSSTRQGAASTFLKDTVKRMISGRAEKADYRELLPESFMLSADNGHAVHPNHPEKCDPTNRPVLNGGVLLKFSANQRYTTDGRTEAMFKLLAEKANVPYQLFFNRSDMLGGSTLGNLSSNQLAIPTADIGLPQLAMHSSMETAGTKDFESLKRLTEVLFE